ncbi:Adenylate cyclase [hydrothermal vent metagenome]|uniref:Adenylate cyclase n=1 Tax=hydrothermal vent metagenome TaxID=652676 RepID=A0A3B1CEI2_9ZZZZ
MTLKKIYLALMAFLLMVAFSPPRYVATFENLVYDQFIYYTAPNEPDPRIVIIGIDQKSLDQYGRWPWPRDVMADLVAKLSSFGVKVTVMDVVFSSKADTEVTELLENLDSEMGEKGIKESSPEFYGEFQKLKKSFARDEVLAQAMADAGNVVTGFVFHGKEEEEYSKERDERFLPIIKPFRIKLIQRSADNRTANISSDVYGVNPNIPIIQNAGATSGFMNAAPDADGVIRFHPIIKNYKGDIYPALALSAANLYLNAVGDTRVIFSGDTLSGVTVGDRLMPLNEFGFIFIRYLGADSTFTVISAADVINKPVADTAFMEKLKGKIAIIGATATQLYDLRSSPLGHTAGVEIQANGISNLLTGSAISKAGWQKIYDVVLVFIIGTFLYYILQRVSIFAGVLVFVAFFAGLLAFNLWMFASLSLWLNSVTPALTILLCYITITVYHYLEEQESRRYIKDAFGRYLSPNVITRLIENPDLLKLGGQRKIMTAFFSDVAGFTSISEQLNPTELVTLLNEYLSEMTNIILSLDGTVDKYEGDAIIAFWGAPMDIKNHAALCVEAAVKMQRKLVDMRADWRKRGQLELYVRMGINTGEMVVGNMGSKQRMDYTMMGDSVNLAARLEGVNKYYGTYTMISEFTHELVKDKFLCLELDSVRVEGKKKAIRLYEVIESKEKATDVQRKFVDGFLTSLSAFREREFEQAKTLFQNLEGEAPEKSTAIKLYLSRIDELIKTPPAPDWDHTYNMAK